jgi:hypothetical protein
MTETPINIPMPRPPRWYTQPFVERRILSGFLKPGEIEVVYPAALEWPGEVAGRVGALHGAAVGLAPRPDAGRCLITRVEEPEALAVLEPIARGMQLRPETTIDFGWVEISNLIAPASVADHMPEGTPLSNEDLKGLAEYSLYEGVGQPVIIDNALLVNSVPLGLVPVGVTLMGNQFLVRYQIIRAVSPIIVGYEEGRCYLLTDYGRVLHAISQNVERLLCIVYYGLDLDKADFGIKFPDHEGAALNHFGRARLSAPAPPLARDFLDPSVGATFPSKGTFFSAQPSLQAILMKYDSPPEGPLPFAADES